MTIGSIQENLSKCLLDDSVSDLILYMYTFNIHSTQEGRALRHLNTLTSTCNQDVN